MEVAFFDNRSSDLVAVSKALDPNHALEAHFTTVSGLTMMSVSAQATNWSLSAVQNRRSRSDRRGCGCQPYTATSDFYPLALTIPGRSLCVVVDVPDAGTAGILLR